MKLGAAAPLAIIAFAALEIVNLNYHINALAYELVNSQFRQPLSNTTLIEVGHSDSPQFASTLESVREKQPKRLFWVLDDAPLTDSQQQLIQRYRLLTVKVPSLEFSSAGVLVEADRSKWQPSAGYLTHISTSYGDARAVPGLESARTPSLSSHALAVTGMESVDASRKVDIDFSKVSINSAVITRAMTASPELFTQQVSGKNVYFISDFSLVDGVISVPYSQSEPGWHPLQYHAAALDALESGATVRELSLEVRALVVALVPLVFAMIFLVTQSGYKRTAVVGVAVLVTGLSAALLQMSHFYPLAAEIFAAFLASFLMMQLTLSRIRKSTIIALHEQLSDFLESLTLSPVDKAKKWKSVANMISQNLILERSILLELDEKTKRLQEIASVNCSIDDINERRRDIRREPYAQALSGRQAVISSRQYFKDKQDQETEVLVPFCKGTTTLGFWAFTIATESKAELQQTIEQANQFAFHISSILGGQQQAEKSSKQVNKLRHLIGSEQVLELSLIGQHLRSVLSELQLRTAHANSMATPFIIFDVFGQVTHINSAMKQLCSDAKLHIENSTAYEFLRPILPLSSDTLKNVIQQISLEQSRYPHNYFVTINGNKFLITLSAVRRETLDVGDLDIHIKLNGMVVEFWSLERMQAYLQIERGLYDHYMISAKNSLSALQLGMMQVEKLAQNPMVKTLTEHLNTEMERVSELTRRTHFFMNKVASREDVNAIPFNPLDILESELEKLTSSDKPNSRKDVTVNSHLPLKGMMGFGSPDAFQRVIQSGLALMVDDAITPKKINVLAKQLVVNGTEKLFIKIDNEGYGIPDEHLKRLQAQAMSFTDHSLLSGVFIDLKTASDAKIDCRLKSRVGKGYRLSMLLDGISLGS